MLDPYFQWLSTKKRLCPDCMKHSLRIEETPMKNPEVAYEVCDGCGYFNTLLLPGQEIMPKGRHRVSENEKPPCHIIKPKFGS